MSPAAGTDGAAGGTGAAPAPQRPAPGPVGSLRAAIVSVGTELLLGDLTDTNATWLSGRLRGLGIEVRHHVAVGDDLDDLVAVLRWLAGRVDAVVVGGGLGPTFDDLTRESVAAAAGVRLDHRDDLERLIAERFASLGRRMAPENARQARVPEGADAFPPVGTAPGFALTLTDPARLRVYALPGVPWELRELFARDVEPELRELAGERTLVTRVVHVVGRGESDVAATVEPLLADRDGVTLAFLARSHEVQVRVTVAAADPEAAHAASQPLVDEVVDALGAAAVGVDEEGLEEVVLRLLAGGGQTVATAESATGGDVAARLAMVPGASRALLGAVVVYDTGVKRTVLGVDPTLLAEHGPVSAPVTAELARLVRERLGADWGIGVTGVAGPDRLGDLPVGTMFWALAGPDGRAEVHERRVPGDRGQVIKRLGTAALDLLRRRLAEG